MNGQSVVLGFVLATLLWAVLGDAALWLAMRSSG